MFGRGDDNGEEESTVILLNPHLSELNGDILYHLGLGTNTHDLVKMFGDVKHGIGVPSLQILLHEIIKLMYYAKVKNPVFFRIGTCGGIGIKAGSVVVSKGAVNEMIEPYYEQIVLGEKMQRPAKLDQDLAQELLSLSEPDDGFDVISGQTMCSYDFYEGQGRCDGAFCYFSEVAKQDYLKKLHDAGVRNIEMEATCFSALTNLANIKAAIVCVAFLNRFEGDQKLDYCEFIARLFENYKKLIDQQCTTESDDTMCMRNTFNSNI
ncbi:unnamed protein product [Trichogramma brassicae]|uniref:Nucleoside phosphorylase domain-containing protein n=1 Tax=Trichogramma brassicae TaxID=86971 RepID=A0A6H5IEX4_9HYME|nr:unnamed protein product [Trichogramma brassicae]